MFFPYSVLLQLASDALPNDVTLALAYLLALPQVSLPLPRKEDLKMNELKLFVIIVYFTCLSVYLPMYCQYPDSKFYNVS